MNDYEKNEIGVTGEAADNGDTGTAPGPAEVNVAHSATPEPAPVPAPDPAGPTDPAPPVGSASRRPRLRTALTYALPVLVLLGSGIGSLAYAKSSADGADRTVVTNLWDREEEGPARPESDFGKGSTHGQLRRQLLPVPDGYALGPYVSKDGNDVELGSRQIGDLLSSVGDDPEGKRLEKLLREAAPRALAMRSYVTPEKDAAYFVTLSQSKEGSSAVANLEATTKALKGAQTKGPKVPGHAQDAACFVVPEKENWKGVKSGVGGLTCLGTHGDLVASLEVTGSTPLDKSAATRFFARQLDRLKSTGTAV
ncbi:hypothetical protein [Streptomyces sp. NEAU-H3]|uniref:hypothetical protein n=1 Tax=unclassified Streptomyces TaxID=2593676 RepID=UPI00143AD321|nr:hypothetical protein [Streptomyces sp. NEAU-H3]NJA58374.1 hypothetical protein [Streptomyces sp. NEAU-H3]